MPVAARCPHPVLLPASLSPRSLLALLYGLTRIEEGVECYLSTGAFVVDSCVAAAARHTVWLPQHATVCACLPSCTRWSVLCHCASHHTLAPTARCASALLHPAKCLMVCCCCSLPTLQVRCPAMP